MRYVAQAKQGFYPAAAEAVRQWAAHLRVEDPEKTTILDPCAGRGDAIRVLGEALGLPQRNVYAVELDAGRGVELKQTLPEGVCVQPADFCQMRAQAKTFSVAWVNPPFDDELGGGGREETRFVSHALRLVVPGGIVGLVLPKTVLERSWATRELFNHWLDDVRVLEFPEEHRPYKEVVVTGKRRKEEGATQHSYTSIPMGTPMIEWPVPAGRRPSFFEKGGPTQEELQEALESSPLSKLFRTPKRAATPRPILPLSNGHVSLLLASGQVDGVVRPEGEPAHVVRGVTRKERYVAGTSTEETADGKSRTTVTTREKIVLAVRTVDEHGIIRSYE